MVGSPSVLAGQSNCCRFFFFLFLFVLKGKSVRWQRKGLAMACRGLGRAGGREWGEGGLLPVALAPTGSNLEQTVPNVFIRL